MMRRESKLNARIIAAAIVLAACSVNAEVKESAELPSVTIDYYFEAGCADCFRVRSQVMPGLKERYEGFYALNEYDLSEKTNVLRLIAYQEKLGIKDNKPVSMIVDYGQVLNGFEAIKNGLAGALDDSIAARMEPGWKAPEPLILEQDAGLAQRRMRNFTLAVVAGNGLIDGINPCAISTLVFFMSLLGVSKIRGAGLLAMGGSFCLASFITYTAIGFGLLRVLYVFEGFLSLRFGVELFMMAALGVLAFLSFRDAYRYRKSGNPGDVTIQLPDSIKMRLHAIMRHVVGREGPASSSPFGRDYAAATAVETPKVGRHGVVMLLAAGGLFLGMMTTAVESVCTGQVYLPTLIMVIKTAPGQASEAWRYLLVYNLMFILPLVAVFTLTYFGLRTHTLLEWSKRNVVMSKILLGLFFLAMATLIILL